MADPGALCSGTEFADELDSYMYQTVGHQAIHLQAEAMELPLYRRTIRGCSLNTSRNYSVTEGDEVEDLPTACVFNRGQRRLPDRLQPRGSYLDTSAALAAVSVDGLWG
ncbi:Diphthine--ammonia ligase [Liparis tanakae]|uniref:Diphthine--ammonia ligase n=1 Tax=Liparis tanakae TaxID=230148 RepID=A0A4Z2FUT1_9TELE|nr:Diphthine--ammonia ligase [Liparis tanakae]